MSDRDIVNAYFRRFYPVERSPDKFEYSSMLGGMLRYKDRAASNIFPRMECADGFSMSVQGHYGSYSSPRDDFADNYTSVEVGFPSAMEPLLMPYAEDDERPTETVYGYVPVAVVAEVIALHGGLKISEPTP